MSSCRPFFSGSGSGVGALDGASSPSLRGGTGDDKNRRFKNMRGAKTRMLRGATAARIETASAATTIAQSKEQRDRQRCCYT